MLRRFSLNQTLIITGIVLTIISFISIWSLPLQFGISINWILGSRFNTDPQIRAAYLRLSGDCFLLQSIYIFSIGIVLLVAGLFKNPNR